MANELLIQLEALEEAAFLDVYRAATPTVAVALGLSGAEIGNGSCTACSSVPNNPFHESCPRIKRPRSAG